MAEDGAGEIGLLAKPGRCSIPATDFSHCNESLMLRFLSCFAALFVAAASAQAQQPSRLDEIVSRGTLRVGMTGDYMPFTYLDKETQKFRGFDVDMAEALWWNW
jgi:hypothetical protein